MEMNDLPREVLDAIEKARHEGRVVEYGHVHGIGVSPPASETPEADFQRDVIAYAQSLGWAVVEFRKARTKRGWITPFGADGVGFTDLLLCRDRVIFPELKSETGRLRPDQEKWRDRLLAAGAEWYCWTPEDWPEIEETLR